MMIISERERGLNVKFERVRRITGYLVGTLDTWNSAKRAEERDRVKHQKTWKRGNSDERLCKPKYILWFD